MSVSFPLIQVALDGLRRWNINLDGVDLGLLQGTLAVVQAIYDEAEVKQFTHKPVKLWLDPVKQLLYDVEDILNGFLTELQILKFKSEHHENHPHQTQQDICERFASKVRDIHQKLKSVAEDGARLGLNSSMGSGSGSSSRHRRTPTSSLMSNRSKFVGRNDDITSIVEWLLDHETSGPSDKDQNFSVLTIVGMPGSGKTALAQAVYNDDRVKDSGKFDVKAWGCISDEFDVVRLTKEILQSATRSSEDSNSLELLQAKLTETLANKSFLLVLDDMWNVDRERWEALSSGFAVAEAGSKILITTQNKDIAPIVGTVRIHDLKALSNDHCSAMFRKHAFVDENSSGANKKWEEFGQKIVEKCKGLPLAVKTLAGLLRYKNEYLEWKEILENELWNERGGILPSLLLSYNHLPPHLKRCFQYCALFPKDYVFDKIELVVLWMAEGMVQPRPEGKQKRVEDIGAAYFDELFKRSFFELSDRFCYYPFHLGDWATKCIGMSPNEVMMRSFFESSSVNTDLASGYVMHDLIHDLAQFVSGGIFCRREELDNKSSEVHTTTRHLSSFIKNFDVKAIESEAMERLRTIIDLSSYAHITEFQFQFLRVLRLQWFPNRELPDSIGDLKQLRLLDLSFSEHLVRLPNSVTSLYNLQTLILWGCERLNELPNDIGNLINLRHFSLPWPNYLQPLGVGNLTHLQKFTPFTMVSKNCMVLKDLSQLHGILEITDLEDLGNINGTEPVVANLKNKPHVFGLHLHWSVYKSMVDSFPDLGRDEKVEEDVLDQLQPHTNLQMLWVENYGGTRFPSWMEYPSCFSNLETVELIGCYKCKFLPHLQQLPLLKHLKIEGSGAKKLVRSELCGDGSSSSTTIMQFRSLETLTIVGMKEWEEWPQVVEESEEGGGQFPCLRELIIEECPKLRELPWLLPSLRHLSITGSPRVVELPHLPVIEKLYLGGCEQITKLSGSCYPSSMSSTTAPPPPAPCIDDSFRCLCELEISNCPNLSCPPLLPSIKELKLVKCKGMAVLNNKMVPCLSSLLSLTIDDVSDLKSLSNGFLQRLTALQELNIHNCGDLMILLQNEIEFDLLPSSLRRLCISQCDNAGKLPQSMHNLQCLQELIIRRAKGLASLSEELHNLRSLQILQISICEDLVSLPRELHTLTSLQEILIESCSALVSFHETKLPAALLKLEIKNCENLQSLPEELHTSTSLQGILIERCPALVSLHKTKLPTALLKLEIRYCKNLQSLPEELHTATSLQGILIERCPALVSLRKTRLPTVLLKLEIRYCKNLRSLPEELHTATSLQEILIERCPVLVSLHKTKLPTALLNLEIRDCKNLRLPEELHTITSLQKIVINECPALVSLHKTKLPTALLNLEIRDCKHLQSLPEELHTITSLQRIVISECPALVSFHETKFPYALEDLEITACMNLESVSMELWHNLGSLQSLVVGGCPNLKSPVEGLHKLTSLKWLVLYDCPALESSLMMDGKNQEPQLYRGVRNLSTLQALVFGGCPALISIPKGMLPINLREFRIYNCPNLESVHALSDMSSLEELEIDGCPLLTQRYQMKEGEEWSKISKIPKVIIDGKRLNQFK